MEIRIRSTGQVVYEGDFRSMYPDTSFPPQLTPELLDSFGADPVLEGPQATTTNQYQYSMRQGVEQIGDYWYTKYVPGPIFRDTTNPDGTVITADQQEKDYKARVDSNKADSVRNQRDNLLKQSDWTQMPDNPKANKADWATYRQALRDLPSQSGFPWTVNWPAAPK